MVDHLPALLVSQKLTLMVNRYDVHRAGPDGQPAELLATAQQKRMAFREQVTFYADAERTTPVFGFRARQRVDLGATYDVTDAAGDPLATFRKDFGRSLLRSTFVLSAPGIEATGQERSTAVAIVRRFAEVPLPFHFDFVTADGRPVLTSERGMSLRDRYRVSVPADDLDWRVAAAMAVGLDALMSR